MSWSGGDVGSKGYVVNTGSHINVYGSVTSSAGVVKVHTTVWTYHCFALWGVVTDYSGRRVSLDFTVAAKARGDIDITGGSSNTYTGDTTVTGNVFVQLFKKGGATAIPNDMYIRDGAVAQILYNEQIANKAKVSLISNRWSGNVSTIGFLGEKQYDLKETIRELAVKGRGVIDFALDGKANGEKIWGTGNHGQRWLYLDELNISYGSMLTIKNWAEGRDFLLVKKSAGNLKEMLKRMEFEGYDRNAIHLENYNWEYWKISGAPEPATYGAILAAAGLITLAYRKRGKCSLAIRWDTGRRGLM